MEMWQCPKCRRTCMLADGQNGRPTRKALVDPTGAPIKTESQVFYCAACDNCFEAVEAVAADPVDRKRKPNIDHEGLTFNVDGTVTAIEKVPKT